MLAILRIFSFLLMILLFLLPVWLVYFTGMKKAQGRLLVLFYRGCGLLWGIRRRVRGEIAKGASVLLVSNHCSYLDVPVLGSILPVRFTPKQDVRSWPVIGYLCKLSNCVFIDRRRSQTSANKKNLENALQSGVPVSIFPEGTTNDGFAVEPFRSSYFSIAHAPPPGVEVMVQPVTVRYVQTDGSQLSREEMDRIAWYGDAEFASHLWHFLQSSGAMAEVTFHPPVEGRSFQDRKALAQFCHQQVNGAFLPAFS
jgi:1-acyl-sn-glycerol-3-phosphate acyltransferase